MVDIEKIKKEVTSHEILKLERVEDVFDGIPVLKITYVYPDRKERPIGYLSEFRKYGFQISATAEGEWDKGSIYNVNIVEMARNLSMDTCIQCYDAFVQQIVRNAIEYASLEWSFHVKLSMNRDKFGITDEENASTEALNSWFRDTVIYLRKK